MTSLLPSSLNLTRPAHRRARCAVLWLLSGAPAALAAAPGGSHWPERYELQPVLRTTVVDDMRRCVGPQVAGDAVQEFVAQALAALNDDPARSAQLSAARGQGVVVAAAGRWACVGLSGEGFPLWPVETLHGLIVPVGVPAELTRIWRRELLAQISRDGVGRGLIVYPSGDADQVLLIAEQRQALNIKFSTRLLPAGSFDVRHYTAVLRHPALKRLVTRSSSSGQGTPSRLAIPPHRLLQPVRDGFVALEPTDQTRRFSFVGTQWVLHRGSGNETLVLQADGAVLAVAPAPSATAGSPHAARMGSQPDTLRGHWRLRDGVLQMSLSDGTHYALTLREDPHTLSGVARRLEAADEDDDESAEWQWPAELRRRGAPAEGGRQQQVRAGPDRALPPLAGWGLGA